MVLGSHIVRIDLLYIVIFFQNFSTNFRTRTPSVFNANLTFFRKISDDVNFVVEGHEIAQMKGIGELNSYI